VVGRSAAGGLVVRGPVLPRSSARGPRRGAGGVGGRPRRASMTCLSPRTRSGRTWLARAPHPPEGARLSNSRIAGGATSHVRPERGSAGTPSEWRGGVDHPPRPLHAAPVDVKIRQHHGDSSTQSCCRRQRLQPRRGGGYPSSSATPPGHESTISGDASAHVPPQRSSGGPRIWGCRAVRVLRVLRRTNRAASSRAPRGGDARSPYERMASKPDPC
jgi:hypothetical protein